MPDQSQPHEECIDFETDICRFIKKKVYVGYWKRRGIIMIINNDGYLGEVRIDPDDVQPIIDALKQASDLYIKARSTEVVSESHMSKDGFPGYPAE